ncbi:acetyl-CoA synthetase-like protein [Aspergillus taichungensis]|uniref:Acetyl-CoA synthetase-like protein n=1 Tax=Aspergillus taichungensis TaxID=482145 RepID=A0A2J5I6V9_9EURO|nr:acetyl-CoA synthetase-like protein [Aspergillus taichungensis]
MMLPVELHGPALPDPDTPLHEILSQNVVRYPDTVALVSTQQPPTLYGIRSWPISSTKDEPDYLRWTYRDLSHATQRLVFGLQSQGLKKGDPLVILMPNTAEYVMATWAAYQIGCAYVPLNPKGLSNTREMRHMLQLAREACQSEALVIIAGTADMCARVEDLTSGLNCTKILVEGETKGWIPFNGLMQNPVGNSQPTLCADPHSRLSDKTVFFTSGTTSLPKGCIIPSAYAFASALRWRQSDAPMEPGDRVLFTLPNNHGLGWLWIISAFLSAATVVIPGPRFSPDAVAKAIREEQVSHAGLVPTMLHALSSIPPAARTLSSLRRIIMGGSAPTEEVIRICLDTLGASGVENIYGMTEGILVSSGVVSQTSDIIKNGHVSIGTPFPGMSVRVHAKDSKVPAAVGEVGEMHFSGASLIDNYIGGADENFYMGDDGRLWFRTGDKAFIGSDNRLYLIGRYKDTIIRGGENIDPSAIEVVLGQIPEFHALQPQIVRAPNHVAGEVPVAVVNQKVDEYTADSLKKTILERMGDLYVPADVIPIQALGQETYPTTMAGKVQKTKLEDLVRIQVERQHTDDNHRIDGPISGPQVMQSLCMAIEKEKGHPLDPSLRVIELGIDSIMSISIIKRVQIATGVSLPSSLFFTQATVGAICQQISSISETADFADFTPIMEDRPSNVCHSVLLQGTPRPGVAPVFLTPPGSGNALVYRTLPKFVDDRAVYSFASPFLMTKRESTWTIEETATIYANTIRSLDPHGPYILGGWSMGTATAYETAYQLHEQGKQVLGIFMLDLALPRPPPHIPEATVELFEMMGVFPPIRREGKPDVEVPGFRRRHRVAAYYAKMKYRPRPFDVAGNASRPRIFIIWAGHGDHDRMADMVGEAQNLLKVQGPGAKMKVSGDWLQAPRASFDAGGWDEMVGPEYVDWGVVADADHDTLIEDEKIVGLTLGLMEKTIGKWVREFEMNPNGCS